jgi:hypothetical protein
MKLAVVSLHAGDEHAHLAGLAGPGWRSYCRRFGYDYHVFDRRIDPHRPASWSKILAILQVLPRYDWVFWTDADVLVWKPWMGLRRFVADCDTEGLVFEQDANGINSGAFFVRNDPRAHRFLGRVYDQTAFVDHPWWEQAATASMVAEHQGLIRLHGRGALKPGFHGFFHEPPWDHVVLHFAGNADRRRVMEQLATLAELPDEQRLLRRDELGDLLNRCDLLGDGVEVGVACGRFSRTILDCWEGRRLHLVDAWRQLRDYRDISNVDDVQQEHYLATALTSLKPHVGRFEVHRELSLVAAQRFRDESLDFVYLDANHAESAVTADLIAWYPKVRAGGLIAGHDYLDGDLPQGQFGVKSAVRRFAARHDLHIAVTAEFDWPTWYCFKPK